VRLNADIVFATATAFVVGACRGAAQEPPQPRSAVSGDGGGHEPVKFVLRGGGAYCLVHPRKITSTLGTLRRTAILSARLPVRTMRRQDHLSARLSSA